MFRGGSAEPGVIRTTGPDAWGMLAWRFRTGGAVRSSPVVAEGVVFVGSSDGHVYAVDAVSGAERWRYDAGSAIGGAPLVTEDLVVVVDRTNGIHAVARGSGDRRWHVQGDADVPLVWGLEGWDYILASPVVTDGMVLTGTGDGRLYAIAAETGDVRWTAQTGGRLRSAPAVHQGVAYVGAGDGVVYGFSLADGSEVWRFVTAGHDLDGAEYGFDRTQIYSSPTIAGGTLYVGSRDASLYAVDLESRAIRWTFEDGTSWVMSSPTVSDGLVLSARSSSGMARALRVEDGTEVWSSETGGFVFSSPVVAGETVYLGSGSGTLHAFDRVSGAERWSYRTDGGIFGTPAIWDGRLYIGSDDGHLYAFEAGTGPMPHTAVYWDETLKSRAVWGRADPHKRVLDYFTDRGYASLDSSGSEAFLRARIADGEPSVLVVAMDVLPTTLTASDGTPLLRRYLDRGGKVVWMGFSPLVIVRDDSGAFIEMDRDRPTRLLDVDHGAFNADEYGTEVTAVGRVWGLEMSAIGMPIVDTAEAVTVLERTASGGASAWVRSYGGAPGTGFVHVRMGLEEAYLHEVRRVVEYGILRKPMPGGAP
jgi:outer membrane protein assembly factor BamB